MNKMYDSLKEVVQETLQRNKTNPATSVRAKGNEVVQETLQPNKTNPTASVRVKGNNASMLNDEMDALEKMVVASLARLRNAVKEGEAMVASEAQRAEQVIENHKAKVAVLEAKLRETEETILGREVARQKTEANLTAGIATLQDALKQTEGIVREKESTIKSLEQDNSAKIHDLENQLKTKEKLLTNRSREVIDLKAQLELLKNGIKEMSSFFKQSEVLGVVEGQDKSAVSPKGEAKTAAEKTAPSQGQGKSAATEPDATQEIISPEFFKQLTVELTQIVGPMASMIIRDHVKALGETAESFPKARVMELLETISTEILDEKVKTGFRDRLAQINGHL